jgi:outer membrane receptor protein involved in Fe transport
MKIHKIIIQFCVVIGFGHANAENKPIEKIDSVSLSEIVVHASRDNLKLKQLPVSVSIISSQQIENLSINSLTDVTSTVPNLFMPDYGSKLTSPIYIRGIGSRINSPSVGLYVDHVPYFEKAAFNFDFFDIQRIEVLRGPQGTQYGRNTMGGIVNILTKSPWEYQGTDLNLQAATYGSYLMSVGHYAKPNDKFAYSLALNYRHNDGFFNNDFLKQKVDKLNSYGMRNRLSWQLNETLSIENILSFEHSEQGGYPYAVIDISTGVVSPISYNQPSGYNRDLLSDAFVVKNKWKKMELTATTSYQYLNDKQSIDQDFTKDSLYFVVQKERQNMVSQELILNSRNNKKYNWLFGAYGFVQQFNSDVDVNTYKKKTETLKTYDHSIGGVALFHQSTLKNFPFRNFITTAGIRLDAENDKLSYRYDVTKSGTLSHLVDTTYNTLKSMQLLPKLAVNYQLKSTNMYAAVTRGYKTGGFNSTFERPEDITFEPEYSWNYEIGIKASLFGNRLFLESSLFYIDWKNQQIYQTTPSGTGSMLKNAGHSESKGLEISANTATFAGFSFVASYGYTHATFLDNKLNATTDYSGNYIPYVPKNTFALQANKSFEIRHSNILNRILLHASYKGTGEIYWDDKNSYKQNYYGLIDARISFVRKNVKFDIWGTNLGQTKYDSFYFEALGRKYVQTGRPLQAGVKLAVNL